MPFVHSAFSMRMSHDFEGAYTQFKELCEKYCGNMHYVATELGAHRFTVGRWLKRFVEAGKPDPRGAYAPGGEPVPQRRRRKPMKPRGLAQ